jgi:lipoprotein-anchoring transpeptidase ErfK/SrfK
VDTLKTVFVVGLLGVVLYGAYSFLSKEEATPPPEVVDLNKELDDLSAPEIDLGPSLKSETGQYEPVVKAELSPELVDSYGTAPEYGADPYPSDSYGESSNVVDGSGNPVYSEVPDYDTGEATGSPDPYGENYASQAQPRPAYGDRVDSSVIPTEPMSNPYVGSDAGTSNTSDLAINRQTIATDAATGEIQPRADAIVADWVGEKQSVTAMLADGQYYEGLRHLTNFYRQGGLTETERAEALDMLDPLAGKVIYSTEHLIERPYVVQPNESLIQIGEKFQVPWQLLRNINGIDNLTALESGTQLKVIRGPFSAEVDSTSGELTLFVQNAYAGRFAVEIGSNPPPTPGRFQVEMKEPGKTFATDTGALPKDHDKNPYGRVWIDLGNSIGIHGSHQAAPNRFGCISLAPADAADVYAILSQGSTVIVR